MADLARRDAAFCIEGKLCQCTQIAIALFANDQIFGGVPMRCLEPMRRKYFSPATKRALPMPK